METHLRKYQAWLSSFLLPDFQGDTLEFQSFKVSPKKQLMGEKHS